MVEADEHHPVGGVRRRNKARNPIDGEVGAFRLLDLDEEPHPLAVRPVKHFDKCRDPCPGKALMKPGSRIESADPLETEIGCEAMAIGRSVDREVMQNDRLAVRGQHDVDLDHRCAPGFAGARRSDLLARGTGGSNPRCSSGESSTNLKAKSPVWPYQRRACCGTRGWEAQ